MVVHKNSDMNERAKRTIHTQEIIRILRNNSRELPEEIKNIGIKKYAAKMQNSEYDKKYIYEVIKSGYEGYDRVQEIY